MENLMDNIKKAVNGVKKFADKIKKAVEFLSTSIGQAVGAIVLALFLLVVIYVISETVQNAIGTFFDEDYAGIATTSDYETIVGGITYKGYDSFISEEKWQEYAAFEYAVLMDVAEHIYEYQDYVTDVTNGGETYQTSAVFPEGITKTQYDAYSISKSEWQKAVAEGQSDNAPEAPNKTVKNIPGGNREVTTPRLIYELRSHEYESDAVSLMPYLVIVRENLKLNYYLKEDEGIEPVRFSAELNRYNYNMPNSAYKKDLEEDQEGKFVVGLEDPEGFIEADRYYINGEGYGADVYYTEHENDIIYKIPLKLLINRYLPKSTLLTTWYMLKKDDESGSGFKIDEMMDAIKQIYNSACYEKGMSAIKPITTTGKKDPETGKITSEGSGVSLRTGEESLIENKIENAVQYDKYGAIKRDKEGKAKLGNQKIKYATTNKRTFIYFEQFGLETSRYEQLKDYMGSQGDEENPNSFSPSAVYLTREKNNFVQAINMKMYVLHNTINGPEWDYTPNLKLKTTYSHADEPGVELFEKFKALFLGLDEKIDTIKIQQEAPYNFMAEVVRRAEDILKNNPNITQEKIKPVQGTNPEDKENIYEHEFINQFYLIAEDGRAGMAGAPDVNNNPQDVRYRLPEDFRYYNQDYINYGDKMIKMPNWYDLTESAEQDELEAAYLQAFISVCQDPAYEAEIIAMLESETGWDIITYDKNNINYYYSDRAQLYKDSNRKYHTANMQDVLRGAYKVNYYWKPVYVIEEKKLEKQQTIHHVRMPVLLVKYCDFWAKSVEYTNTVTQNPIDYRSYKHLIPNAITSLGVAKLDLQEKASYRVETFKKFYNKADGSMGAEGIKEGDVLDMLIQWEEYANRGRK